MKAPPDTEAQLKLALMRVIDADLKDRFKSLEEAAYYADVTPTRLSRMRCGRHDLFSINWLFRLADTACVPIRISIDSVNR